MFVWITDGGINLRNQSLFFSLPRLRLESSLQYVAHLNYRVSILVASFALRPSM
jgi:hypothetical protein